MVYMKLKRLLKITVFACLLFSVVSCQNDSPEEVMYSKTSMEQQTEQKLQCLYDIKTSLFSLFSIQHEQLEKY